MQFSVKHTISVTISHTVIKHLILVCGGGGEKEVGGWPERKEWEGLRLMVKIFTRLKDWIKYLQCCNSVGFNR